MPDDKSLADIERILTDRQNETLQELDKVKASAIPPALDGTIGRVTHIDAHQQHQIVLRGQRNLEQQLERVRGALLRVKDGTYGACVRCGTPIAPARLEFTPEALYCIPCQQLLEREGRA